jgi:hypothetical protein
MLEVGAAGHIVVLLVQQGPVVPVVVAMALKMVRVLLELQTPVAVEEVVPMLV